MAILGVNVDHVATVRQARQQEDPDPIMAARICETAGASSIVAHLREDRRHIQDRDVVVLRRILKTRFNLEMSLSPSIVEMAAHIKPHQVTLVPERRLELTTEGGLDVTRNYKKLAKACAILKKAKIDISLFVAPDRNQILATKDLGINIIELHTGKYAHAYADRDGSREFKKIADMTAFAIKHQMTVNAGHGLNYVNVKPIAKIKGMHELNIGHSIISRAVFVGLKQAVKEMLVLIK
jgi:pyridoxine 5-phosphate synthase